MEANHPPNGPVHERSQFTELKRRLGTFLLGLTAWIIILMLIIPPLKTGLSYLLKL